MATYQKTLPVGTRLENYTINSVLGEGGFGITYKAYDEELQLDVAIKEYLPSQIAVRHEESKVVAESESVREDYEYGLQSFLEEARTLARFTEPNIVRVHRFFRANGTGYIVMEFVEGQTFTEYLAKNPDPTENQVTGIMLPILDGLRAVHNARILHRDIKPDNLYIRDNGIPMLIDFGASREALGQHSKSVTGIVTPGYAPFEQYNTKGQHSPATDLYALGATMYRAVTGNKPPEAPERIGGLHGGDGDPMVPAVEAAQGRYSEKLLSTIDWMLRIAVDDRPASVQQVIDRLLNEGDMAPIPEPAAATAGEEEATTMLMGRGGSENTEESTRMMGRSGGSSGGGMPPGGVPAGGSQGSGKGKKGLWIGLAASVVVLVGGFFALGGIEGIRNLLPESEEVIQQRIANVNQLQAEVSQLKKQLEDKRAGLSSKKAGASGDSLQMLSAVETITTRHVFDSSKMNDLKAKEAAVNGFIQSGDYKKALPQLFKVRQMYTELLDTYKEAAQLPVTRRDLMRYKQRWDSTHAKYKVGDLVGAKQAESLIREADDLEKAGKFGKANDRLDKAMKRYVAALESKEYKQAEESWERQERDRIARDRAQAEKLAWKRKFLNLRGGNFRMGGMDSGSRSSERPVRTVRVSPFRMMKTEVTVGDFRKFVRATGYRTDAERHANGKSGCFSVKNKRYGWYPDHNWRNPGYKVTSKHPVVCLSPNDIRAYTRWLNKKYGKYYRLPSEAEWEYAARAGSTDRYSHGNSTTDLCRYANGADITSRGYYTTWASNRNCDDGFIHTAPVGTFKPNRWGFYDMTGNAWEWTSDCYHPNYNGAPTSSGSWGGGDCSRRMIRGGSWTYNPNYLRVAYRYKVEAMRRDGDLGFRLVEDTRPRSRVAGTTPSQPAAPSRRTGSVKPGFLSLRGGLFSMGGRHYKAKSNEKPVHNVRVGSYKLGRLEVTVGEFRRFITATGYRTDAERHANGKLGCFSVKNKRYGWYPDHNWRNPGFPQTDNHPVVCVSINDVRKYLAWLNRTTGKYHRLPSEAEWEYAARARTTSPYYHGSSSSSLCQYGNGADLTSRRYYTTWAYNRSCSDGYIHTAPVGSFKPNRWGFYDMTGNVWEWTADCYHGSYYGAPTDGSAWTEGGDCNTRAIRGGSWTYNPDYLRVSYRYTVKAYRRDSDLGFRVVQEVR